MVALLPLVMKFLLVTNHPLDVQVSAFGVLTVAEDVANHIQRY
jgi:hypothetical protein